MTSVRQDGKIISAKVENKFIVDFLASYNGILLPLMQQNVYLWIGFDGQRLKPINRIFGQALSLVAYPLYLLVLRAEDILRHLGNF